MKDLPRPGDLLSGRYRVDTVAGEGAMGIVYAAHHLMLDQRVALKVMHPESARHVNLIERFVREARAAARIMSPHVARVYDAGVLDSGIPFFAMELLEGVDLAELVSRNGPQRVEVVADWLLQALAALAQAHALGVVHRDLKPANLFLARQTDGTRMLKILDFGISKVSNEDGNALTGRQVLGTPMYMSPEQLQDASEIDFRSDFYSLGVVAFELLTGEVPFVGEGVGELFAAILGAEAVSLRTHQPSVPKEFEDVVIRAMMRDRTQRFQSAAEFAAAVAPFASERERPLAARVAEMPAPSTLVMQTPSQAFKIPALRALPSVDLPSAHAGEGVATADTDRYYLPHSGDLPARPDGLAVTEPVVAPEAVPSTPLVFVRARELVTTIGRSGPLSRRALAVSAVIASLGLVLIGAAVVRSLTRGDTTAVMPYEAAPPATVELPSPHTSIAAAPAPSSTDLELPESAPSAAIPSPSPRVAPKAGGPATKPVRPPFLKKAD